MLHPENPIGILPAQCHVLILVCTFKSLLLGYFVECCSSMLCL